MHAHIIAMKRDQQPENMEKLVELDVLLVRVPDPQQKERVWYTSNKRLVPHCQHKWASYVGVSQRL